jgi:hypothetical protein
MLRVGLVFTCSIVFLAVPSVPAAADVLFSSASATGCDYDALGPGGVFQGGGDPYGNPCDIRNVPNGPAFASFSFTIHPGLSGEDGAPSSGGASAIPGANASSLWAYAENGGGGSASSSLSFKVENKNTGQVDTNAIVFMSFTGFADISTSDKFRFWNNSGFSLCIGSTFGNCAYASASGSWNANNGFQGSSFNSNEMSIGVISPSPYLQETLQFQTNGFFAVQEAAYANLTSVAGLDPIFTLANPDDILLGPPFNSDPNAPLFTNAQLSLFESFGIGTAGIPMPASVPESSRGLPVVSILTALSIAELTRYRRANTSSEEEQCAAYSYFSDAR